jgi:hypothetical protein
MKRIIEIDLRIYPRKIWVIDLRNIECIECFIKTLKFKTKRIDGSFKLISDGFKSDRFDGSKSLVIEATKNDYIGIIIFLLDRSDISSVVHESVHIADYISESLGIVGQNYCDGNENYAYLVEYVFKEINKVYERGITEKSK